MKAAHRWRRKPVRRNTASVIKGLFVAIAILAVTACSGQPLSTREKGTFIGGGLRAPTGASLRGAGGAPPAGAAFGAGGRGSAGSMGGEETRNSEKASTH